MPNQNGTFDMRRNSPRRGAIVTLIIVTIVAVLALILLGLATDFLVNWLWFSELEYLNVFWTVIVAKGMVFLAVFLATLSVLWANGAIALHSVLPPPPPWTQPSMEFTWGQTAAAPPIATELLRHVLRRRTRVIAGAAGILALIVAWAEVPNWDVFLRLLYQVPQGANDPLYDKDIGFYLFSLPAYIVVKNWLLVTVLLSALLAGSIYWIRGDVEFDGQRPSISPRAIAHGSALLGCYFVAKAWSYVLDRYLLLFGDNGVVVGASYTDIHVELPVLWFLTGLAVVGAFLCWANVRARSYKLPLAAVVIVFATSIVLGEITPALIQRVYVKPNELQLEKPYLQYNIALTQQAYNLHRISVKPFPAEQNLDTRALEANQPTIDNIRLWDWQPLMDTYSQMQEIRTYYKFHDIDVDRYWLDGNYQAVMVSARELRSTLLPANAQTWVNRHLLFTHGNGAVMSPVTKKTPAGLPVFYLRDIPPVASGGPEISEPRIYYGEETDDYVIVKSSTPEFNYPKGKDNV